MSSEIHIYTGTVRIGEKSNYKYPLGEKHAFLLYLKEGINSEYNQEHANKIVTEIGLDDIIFSRVGKLDPTKVNNDEKREYYNNAVEKGATFILYSDPI